MGVRTASLSGLTDPNPKGMVVWPVSECKPSRETSYDDEEPLRWYAVLGRGRI